MRPLAHTTAAARQAPESVIAPFKIFVFLFTENKLEVGLGVGALLSPTCKRSMQCRAFSVVYPPRHYMLYTAALKISLMNLMVAEDDESF